MAHNTTRTFFYVVLLIYPKKCTNFANWHKRSDLVPGREYNAGIAPLEGPSPNRKVAWELEMSIHLHSLKGDLHSLSVQMEGLSREKVIAL